MGLIHDPNEMLSVIPSVMFSYLPSSVVIWSHNTRIHPSVSRTPKTQMCSVCHCSHIFTQAVFLAHEVACLSRCPRSLRSGLYCCIKTSTPPICLLVETLQCRFRGRKCQGMYHLACLERGPPHHHPPLVPVLGCLKDPCWWLVLLHGDYLPWD